MNSESQITKSISASRHLKRYAYRYKVALICLFLVMGTISVFWQVHEFDFVDYDDTDYVTENINIQKGFSWDSVAWAFTTVHAANWHPVTWLSHILDYRLFGMHSGKHHLTNLFLHIINTLLLFFVFRKMTGGLWQSAFVAALFAFHPLHVESVAWVSERKDVLSTFFWMLTMGCYAAYVSRKTVLWYLGALVFFAFGLMSKPMLVTLPCVLLLLDYWPLKRFSFNNSSDNRSQEVSPIYNLFLEKIPLVILVVISSGLTYYAQKHGGAVKSLEYIPMADRVANALVSYILYIGKMIYPVKLALLYPHPETLPWRQVLSASLILLFVSSLVAIAIKKHRYLIVGWLWYLGTLVPVIGLVQVGGQALADRYTYVPLIGLFIMIAWGVPEFLKQWKFRKLFLWACSLFLILISAGLSWKQTGFWKNSTVLFEHAAKVTKNNFTMYYNFGNAMAEKGRDDAAKEYYLKALAVKPDSLITNYNLGNLYFKEKNTDAAIEQYLKVLALNPNYSNAQYNLGIALDVQGRPQEALPYLLAALKGMPDNADAFFKTANALIQTGKIDDAIWHYKQALRINPYFVNAHCNLGVALFRKGDVPGSIDAFNETLRLQPDLKSAQLYLRKAMSVQSKKH